MRIAALFAAVGLLMVRPALSQQPNSLPPLTQSVEARCSGLAVLGLENARVDSTELVPAGGVVKGIRLPRAFADRLPAFCRVRITDRPSADSEIHTEVWLPAAVWNGKYLGQGNGGFAGEINFVLMAASVAQGYAAAGTDTGHVGGLPNFALGHPEKVKDFGWRAIHDMTVQAKAVAAAFYGKPPARSYFTACSDGGREALMEAQRFPADYNGILAGAPAYHWTALTASGALDTQAMLATAGSYLPASKLPAIAAAVLAQCDALDGVTDGVLNDPRTCHFDPATMACKSGDAAMCLTPEQVATLRTLYAPKLNANGRQVYPGFLPGAEEGQNGWALWITGYAKGQSLTAFFGHGYFSAFVHEQLDWKITSFDFEKDFKLAEEKNGADLDATDTNLKPFASRGGKLILYHGWNDPAIPAIGTVEYYDGAVAELGAHAANSSLRLYMVPGMQHCGGGPGATEFGEGGDQPRGDAEHDVFTALEQWVEDGRLPQTIVAHGDGITRPLCAYPATSKYISGDPKAATSYSCAAATK